MKTILIIDDNPDILENTAEILELAEFKVLTAGDGLAGVSIARQEVPDLILCDIMMPVMDGFGVFFSLNQHVRTAGIPFIFLTAKAEVADKKYGINLGVDDYITKPFDDELLLTIIRTKIEKSERIKLEFEKEQFKYIRELEDMLYMTSHRVRSPICTCLGLIQLLQENNAKAPTKEEIINISMHIKKNVAELDDFTKELTAFLEDIRQKRKNKLGL